MNTMNGVISESVLIIGITRVTIYLKDPRGLSSFTTLGSRASGHGEPQICHSATLNMPG